MCEKITNEIFHKDDVLRQLRESEMEKDEDLITNKDDFMKLVEDEKRVQNRAEKLIDEKRTEFLFSNNEVTRQLDKAIANRKAGLSSYSDDEEEFIKLLRESDMEKDEDLVEEALVHDRAEKLIEKLLEAEDDEKRKAFHHFQAVLKQMNDKIGREYSDDEVEELLSSAKLQEFYNDELKYEMWDGVKIVTPPSLSHERVLKRILSRMYAFVEEKKIGEVFGQNLMVYLDETENFKCPDITFIHNNSMHLIRNEAVHGTPNLIVEVLSAGRKNTIRDAVDKKALYEMSKVQEYWIVDPFEKEIVIYSLVNDKYVEIEKSSVLEGLEIPATIFGKNQNIGINIEDLLRLGSGMSSERAAEFSKEIEESRNDW